MINNHILDENTPLIFWNRNVVETRFRLKNNFNLKKITFILFTIPNLKLKIIQLYELREIKTQTEQLKNDIDDLKIRTDEIREETDKIKKEQQEIKDDMHEIKMKIYK